MTQAQFEETIAINERIKELKRVLKEFEENNDCRLSLIYGPNPPYGCTYSSLHFVDGKIINFIKDKLKVYTERFVQEIKEEIDELNKKIEKI